MASPHLPPDNHIFTQQGQSLELRELNVRPFSCAADQIASELLALNLQDSRSGQQLLANFSKYGFAVIDPGEVIACKVHDAFRNLRHFLHHAPIEDKMAFREAAPAGMDVKYNPPKLKGTERAPFEEIITQREFVLGKEFQNKWPASATALRSSAVDLMHEFEGVGQKILTIIEALYHAPEGMFAETAFNSDQSTLRMIHCMPESEFFSRPEAYGSSGLAEDSLSTAPLRRCINIHTDWGPLTILPVATSGGLEYWFEDTNHNEGAESGWVHLNACKGQLLAMLGNVSDIFSRGVLRSVPHRVRVRDDQERFSFAYFIEVRSHVNLDSVTSSLKIPDIPENQRSFYEQEAREAISGEMSARDYLQFMINK